MPPNQSHVDAARFRLTASHFGIATSVALPVVFYWLYIVFSGSPFPVTAASAVIPGIFLGAAVAVWAVFSFVVWPITGAMPARPGAGDRVLIVLGGFVSMAVWFLMAALIMFVLPWTGNQFIAVPNLWLGLPVIIGSFVACWFSSRAIANRLGRGPTKGLAVCLALAGLVTCAGVGVQRDRVQARGIAEFNRRIDVSERCASKNESFADPKFHEKGNAHCAELAGRYLTGDGVVRDPARALEILQWGCDVREPVSCARLGAIYETGEIVPRDFAKATAAYGQGCSSTERVCLEWYRMLHDHPPPPDQSVGPPILKYAVSETCARMPKECVDLALRFETGAGVVKDVELAVWIVEGLCLTERGGPFHPPSPGEGCGHLLRLTGRHDPLAR